MIEPHFFCPAIHGLIRENSTTILQHHFSPVCNLKAGVIRQRASRRFTMSSG
jgi:hypothetical protein